MAQGSKPSGRSAGKRPSRRQKDSGARASDKIGRELREAYENGPALAAPAPDRFNSLIDRLGKLERASPLMGSPSTPPPRKSEE